MNINVLIGGLSSYILVFCRMAGMIFFNPLLSRRNLPSQFRVALVLGITILLTPNVASAAAGNMTDLSFLWAMVLELMVGVACGFIFQIFYYLLFTAGDVVDMGFGLSMAKAFDPGTNIQASLSGNFFQLMFIMYIFATDSHLVMIKLMASSYDLVGAGAVTFGADVGGFMITVFTSAFALIMQLALPFMAASFVLEVSMGVLMKLIPQINVFSIHFQFKILFGLILLFLFTIPTSEFIKGYMNTMFINMQNLFGAL